MLFAFSLKNSSTLVMVKDLKYHFQDFNLYIHGKNSCDDTGDK